MCDDFCKYSFFIFIAYAAILGISSTRSDSFVVPHGGVYFACWLVLVYDTSGYCWIVLKLLVYAAWRADQRDVECDI